jgi:inosose dehydratase
MALEVQIGVNPVLWMNDDLPSLGGETPVETALAEGRRIGYRGFELGKRFPQEPEALRALFASHDLSLVSGWYSGRLVARSADLERREAEGHLRLLRENGARVLVYGEVEGSIQGLADVPLYRRPRLRGDDAWSAYGERLTAFARALEALGLRLAYHHHMGAYVETPEEVDRLMAVTGSEVGLLLDSGHAAFAGGDAVELFERHAARVCHVHLKDVRPAVLRMAKNRRLSFLQSVLSGVFTVPGDGALDFGRLLRALEAHGYRGWLVVEAEQDPAVAPSYAFAEKGLRHVEGLVRQLGTGPREAA